MGEKLGHTIYQDPRVAVVLTADEVIIDEVVHADSASVHHVISFSRAAWHEIMSGSEREFRQETER